MSAETKQSWEPAVLAVACALPTVVTLAYFVGAAGAASGVQQVVFAVAKCLQFALPVVWVGMFCHQRLGWPRFKRDGLAVGLLFGLAVSVALWLLYLGLTGSALLEGALEPIRDKIAEMGLATPWRFIALGVFYAVFHSLLEEYYWRWFVFGRLRNHVSSSVAIAISSVAFAAHHVVVLWAYFAHEPIAALLLASCVAIGGAVWAWLYQRSGSIYAVWASHLLVDAAIFAVGYHIARPMFVNG